MVLCGVLEIALLGGIAALVKKCYCHLKHVCVSMFCNEHEPDCEEDAGHAE